jgi:isoleucyl-tRNA synthetase
VARLAAPIAPFYMDRLFTDLNNAQEDSTRSRCILRSSRHDEKLIDGELEERMDIAQKISSMILGLRRKAGIRCASRWQE